MANPAKPIAVEEAILAEFANILKTSTADPVGDHATILTGWPDQDTRVKYPSIYLDIAGGMRRDYAPYNLLVTDVGGGDPWEVDRVVVLGSVELDIHVNIFADAKPSRSEIMGRYQTLLGEVAGEGAIRVSAASYFDQDITYEQIEPFSYMDFAERVGGDEVRARTIVTGYSYEMAGLSGSKLIDLSVEWFIAEVPHLDVVPLKTDQIFP